MCKEEIQTLFKLRSSTIDVKQNQASTNRNRMWCRICFLFPESQKHIFHCSDIRNKLDFIIFSELNYEMIYDDINSQEKFAKVYHLMLEARKDMLDKTSTAGGPLHQ